MSKAMQEKEVFKAWYDCHTVLIGDGKHLHAQYTHGHSGIILSFSHQQHFFFIILMPPPRYT